MCGRYSLSKYPEKLLRALGASIDRGLRFEPRYNIPPTMPVLALKAGAQIAGELRWGLIPPTSQQPDTRLSTINARAETLVDSKLYRTPFLQTRCVVFADGWYEWQVGNDGAKQPYWVHLPGDDPFAFAALWSRWCPPGEPSSGSIDSCAIVTRPALPELAAIHPRMPVALDVERARIWLEPELHDPAPLLALLEPRPSERWDARPVSRRVGNVRNDDASLFERAEPDSPAPAKPKPAETPRQLDLLG